MTEYTPNTPNIINDDIFRNMTIEEKVEAYRQGYRISLQPSPQPQEQQLNQNQLQTQIQTQTQTLGSTDTTVSALIWIALGILVFSGIYVYVGTWELKKLGIKGFQ